MESKGIGVREIKNLIIGAGPAGLFCAYGLLSGGVKGTDILIVEQGSMVKDRYCKDKKKCVKCRVCDVMSGTGGAGGFSDGKFNISDTVGGTFTIDTDKETKEVIKIISDMFSTHGNTKISVELKELLNIRYHNDESEIFHLGTDGCRILFTIMEDYLASKGVVIWHGVRAVSSTEYDEKKQVTITPVKPSNTVQMLVICDNLVVAVGRLGNKYIDSFTNSHDRMTTSRADIGVRLEVPFNNTKHLTRPMYEFKLRTKAHGVDIRTFCVCPQGHVSHQSLHDSVLVNGHSYSKLVPHRRSNTTNFAVLTTIHFDKVHDPTAYVLNRIKDCHALNGSDVITQRVIDFMLDRKSTEEDVERNGNTLTYRGALGNLNMVFPARIASALKEGIKYFNQFANITSDDCWMHGIEAKLYSNTVQTDHHFEATNDKFFIGDGSGKTRGIMQAAISGLLAAERICWRKE